MAEPVNKWIEWAEREYASANRELRARTSPNFDAACLHARICAEAYFKARLEAPHISASKIDDPGRLLKKCLPIEPSWKILSLAANILAGLSIQLAYPGSGADKPQARDAVACCRVIRTFARQSLGLKV